MYENFNLEFRNISLKLTSVCAQHPKPVLDSENQHMNISFHNIHAAIENFQNIYKDFEYQGNEYRKSEELSRNVDFMFE